MVLVLVILFGLLRQRFIGEAFRQLETYMKRRFQFLVPKKMHIRFFWVSQRCVRDRLYSYS